MKIVIALACLFCTCAANYMGYGMMGYGYPMMSPFMGMMQSGSMDNDEMRPQYLTCTNAELLPDGTTVFAVSVSVFDKDAGQTRDSMAAMMNPYLMPQRQERSGLSVSIEVLNTAITGTGLVAFTTRAQPENGCAFEGNGDFGSNLIHTEDSSSGFGFGYGFGMGMGIGSLRNDDGIIAELPITSGRVSSLTVDGLPFKSLEELAGRGVVICSSVSSDVTGYPTCERPYYACCSLSYDTTDHSIEPVLDQLPDPSRFPRLPIRTLHINNNSD